MTTLARNTILAGDAVERLADLPDASVDCVVTSPPYFQLRDYGVRGQLGLEPTVDIWVTNLRAVCRQLARVLKSTGSVWLNLGDSFSRHPRYGVPPKGLLLAPERLLIALAADGWIVRNKVIWDKSNPMPTSVGDRLTLTYEVVYLLVRSRRYFFDLDAIREPFASTGPRPTRATQTESWRGPLAAPRGGLGHARRDGQPGHPLGKNPGDVWRIATRGFRGAHFATFPPALLRRPILATCPEAICTACGTAWRRAVTVRRLGRVESTPNERFVRTYPSRWRTWRETGELAPCGCGAPTVPGVVLDPFMGTGTVAVVARELHRDWIGVELNPDYIELAQIRLGLSPPDSG
jgi:site-specific DNA-methyltransferase (adenine-specific)